MPEFERECSIDGIFKLDTELAKKSLKVEQIS